MAKIDLKKELGTLYAPSSKDFSLVEVPEMNFLMVDGRGDPNTTPAFQEAVDALYAVAYTAKFALKKAGGDDFTVMPLEGLWWMEDMRFFDLNKKDDWLWTVMIAQPAQVTPELIRDAVHEVERKKNPPALGKVRFEAFREGLSAQIMHIGPYEAEAPTIARMHGFIAEHGYEPAGKHHEIYLSDPRRTAPEKYRTILRQPVRLRND